jgi:hypothetical protein
LTFEDNLNDNKTILIHFNRPRGNFDQIHLNCSAQDQRCLNQSLFLTTSIGNCTNCTSISISPIVRGVEYKCQGFTIKQKFDNVTSSQFNFSTGDSFHQYQFNN